MNYLLDTNVVSEWAKSRPEPKVVRWLGQAREENVYVSVLTFAEIWHGIQLMGAGHRREQLKGWLETDLAARFEGRIFGVDFQIARAWGELMARAQKIGQALNAMDAFFASTAEAHGLTLVTRNTKHFERLGIELLNPWEAGPEVGWQKA